MRQKNAEKKKIEARLVEEGKQPFFVKKSDRKLLDRKEKFEELKKNNKLEKYLERVRRKRASKDHRLIPYQRRSLPS